MDPVQSDSVIAPSAPISLPWNSRAVAFCVHHGGRSLRVTVDQAQAFVRRVHRLTDEGGAELVPLLHDRGVDLLHISARTPLQIHDIRDHSLDRSHR